MEVNKLKRGDILYYPSIKGIALICEVLDQSEKDLLVLIEGRQYYLPKASVEAHGILIDQHKAKSYITQRMEDPDNKLVYLRYVWNDSWVDRLYNTYLKGLGRIDEPIVLEAVEGEEEILPDSIPPLLL